LDEKKFAMKMTDGEPKYNLNKYLNTTLSTKKIFDTPSTQSVLYDFTLDKNGKLTSPSVIQKSTLEIDTAIIDALLAAPAWKPASVNGEISAVSITLSFEVTIADDKSINISRKQWPATTDVQNGFDNSRRSFNAQFDGPKIKQ